jgi:hypothetical protein
MLGHIHESILATSTKYPRPSLEPTPLRRVCSPAPSLTPRPLLATPPPVLTAIAASIGAAVVISTLFDFVKLVAELTVIPGKSVSRCSNAVQAARHPGR